MYTFRETNMNVKIYFMRGKNNYKIKTEGKCKIRIKYLFL